MQIIVAIYLMMHCTKGVVTIHKHITKIEVF